MLAAIAVLSEIEKMAREVGRVEGEEEADVIGVARMSKRNAVARIYRHAAFTVWMTWIARIGEMILHRAVGAADGRWPRWM